MQNITVGILGDLAVENNESFTLELFSPRNASLGTSTMTINIRNDDRIVIGSEILSKDLIALDQVIPAASEFNAVDF